MDYLSKGLNDFNLIKNDLFILGDTNIEILDNGENILDKYKDMSKGKYIFGAIPKRCPQICSTLGLKQLVNKTSYENDIFITRKMKKVKTNNHKRISFRSLKNYSMEKFEQELKNIVFPNYEKFSSAYSDLVSKITQVINNHVPYKTIRVKNHSNEWFDGELAEQISNRDKLFKKFKNTNFTSTN